MSKHTPGPWSLENRGYKFIVSKPGDGYITRDVCRMDASTMSAFAQEANARLIAAAPTMLELLKRILPIAEDASESLGRFCSDEGWAQEDMDRMDNVDGMLPLMRAAIKAVEEGK